VEFDYQHGLLGKGVVPTEVEKLIPNFRDKERNLLHYRNLLLYYKRRPEIRTETMDGVLYKDEHRAPENDNSAFGKTMENFRNIVVVKLVCANEAAKLRCVITRPAFSRAYAFDDDCGHPDTQVLPDPQSPCVFVYVNV